MLCQRLKVGGEVEKFSNLLWFFLKINLKNSQSLCLKFLILLLHFLNLMAKISQSDFIKFSNLLFNCLNFSILQKILSE